MSLKTLTRVIGPPQPWVTDWYCSVPLLSQDLLYPEKPPIDQRTLPPLLSNQILLFSAMVQMVSIPNQKHFLLLEQITNDQILTLDIM